MVSAPAGTIPALNNPETAICSRSYRASELSRERQRDLHAWAAHPRRPVSGTSPPPATQARGPQAGPAGRPGRNGLTARSLPDTATAASMAGLEQAA